MAIQIVKHPPKLSWSRNPVLFELQTNNFVLAPGQSQILDFIFLVANVSMARFTLKWNNTEYEFSFRDQLDDSGFTLSLIGRNGKTVTETNLEILRSNYYVNKDFELSMPTDNVIRFTSRHASTKMAAIYSQSTSVHNATVVRPAVDRVLRPNFALYLELFVNGNKYSSSSAEINAEGKVYWNVQDYLTAILQPKAPKLPSLVQNDILRTENAVSEYHIKYAEAFGEPQRIQRLEQSESLYVVLGGMANATYIEESFEGWLDNGIGKLHTSQYHWMSAINTGETKSNVTLCMTVRFADKLERTIRRPIGSWHSNEKLTIPIGTPQWIDELDHDHEPTNIYVWLSEGNAPITSIHDRDLDNRFLPNIKTLAYVNSFGSISTVYVYGSGENGYNVRKSDHAFVQISTNQEHESRELDISTRNFWKFNSGYKTLAEIQSYREFILSSYKYVIIDGNFVPVTLNSSSVEESTDGENLKSIAFELLASGENVIWSK